MENSTPGFPAMAEQYRRRLNLCRQLEHKNSFLQQRIVQFRGTHDPCVRGVLPVLNAQLRQLKDRMWLENNRMAEDARQLSAEIEKLADERLAQIMRSRYLELNSWDDISEATGLGVRWLNRLNRKALIMLQPAGESANGNPAPDSGVK